MIDFTIEPGKFYKAKNGMKVRVYSIDGRCPHPIHGAFLVDDGWIPGSWLKDGFCVLDAHLNLEPNPCGHSCDDGCEEHMEKMCHGEMGRYDIVSPWVEPPVVDWDRFPSHIVALAVDCLIGWRAYMSTPVRRNPGWQTVDDRPYEPRNGFVVEKDDRPDFSGDWRDSLVIRPGYEG